MNNDNAILNARSSNGSCCYDWNAHLADGAQLDIVYNDSAKPKATFSYNQQIRSFTAPNITNLPNYMFSDTSIQKVDCPNLTEINSTHFFRNQTSYNETVNLQEVNAPKAHTTVEPQELFKYRNLASTTLRFNTFYTTKVTNLWYYPMEYEFAGTMVAGSALINSSDTQISDKQMITVNYALPARLVDYSGITNFYVYNQENYNCKMYFPLIFANYSSMDINTQYIDNLYNNTIIGGTISEYDLRGLWFTTFINLYVDNDETKYSDLHSYGVIDSATDKTIVSPESPQPIDKLNSLKQELTIFTDSDLNYNKFFGVVLSKDEYIHSINALPRYLNPVNESSNLQTAYIFRDLKELCKMSFIMYTVDYNKKYKNQTTTIDQYQEYYNIPFICVLDADHVIPLVDAPSYISDPENIHLTFNEETLPITNLMDEGMVIFYVPDALYDSYCSDSKWSAHSNRIFKYSVMSEYPHTFEPRSVLEQK